MNKSYICLFFCVLLLGIFLSIPSIQSSHQTINGYTLFDVHTWPDSQCDICHTSSRPDAASSELINADQSRLCESCHKDTVTILPSNKMMSDVIIMKNHPIKFSPLDFDPEKINHNIIRGGKYFYVSGKSGSVPLFGDTKESAVAECGTCHDPHGKQRIPKLQRIDNSKNQLCLACHINIKT